MKAGHRCAPILIDQGDEDEFFRMGAMKIDAFQAACEAAGQPVTLRMQPDTTTAISSCKPSWATMSPTMPVR